MDRTNEQQLEVTKHGASMLCLKYVTIDHEQEAQQSKMGLCNLYT